MIDAHILRSKVGKRPSAADVAATKKLLAAAEDSAAEEDGQLGG